MVKVYADNGYFRVEGTFDFGYIGMYKDEKIKIRQNIEEAKAWKIIAEQSNVKSCTDDEIAACLTKYINELEAKIQKNIKQVNDNFLLRVFEDMEACGAEFWECEELTVSEKMPNNPEEDIYQPNYDTMRELIKEYENSANDGSVDKTDVEAVLRKIFPMFDFDNFISGIVPGVIGLLDTNITFQCSDKFDNAILCAAYDMLDSELRFTDWHNF